MLKRVLIYEYEGEEEDEREEKAGTMVYSQSRGKIIPIFGAEILIFPGVEVERLWVDDVKVKRIWLNDGHEPFWIGEDDDADDADNDESRGRTIPVIGCWKKKLIDLDEDEEEEDEEEEDEALVVEIR